MFKSHQASAHACVINHTAFIASHEGSVSCGCIPNASSLSFVSSTLTDPNFFLSCVHCTCRGMFSYPDLGMLVVAFLSGNLSMCPLPRKDLAPPRPPLGGFSHWNMRCSVFKAHKGRLTACAAMGCSIATGSAAGGVKIVDARDLHAQVCVSLVAIQSP